jgi:hypothetical protein
LCQKAERTFCYSRTGIYIQSADNKNYPACDEHIVEYKREERIEGVKSRHGGGGFLKRRMSDDSCADCYPPERSLIYKKSRCFALSSFNTPFRCRRRSRSRCLSAQRQSNNNKLTRRFSANFQLPRQIEKAPRRQIKRRRTPNCSMPLCVLATAAERKRDALVHRRPSQPLRKPICTQILCKLNRGIEKCWAFNNTKPHAHLMILRVLEQNYLCG